MTPNIPGIEKNSKMGYINVKAKICGKKESCLSKAHF